MDMDDYEENHTSIVKDSQEEAERAVSKLRRSGWEIYPEKVPLQGQWGFYCVRTFQDTDGFCRKRAHSVRWNIFDDELQPVTIACRNDQDLLSFVWTHALHEGFDHFEYGDGDMGFVCYCHAHRQCSLGSGHSKLARA